MPRTRGADRFSTELTVAMGPTALEAQVLTTAGSPPSPCRLVIEHDVAARAEIVLFDGSFDGTTFRTTALTNRYRPGSAAGSGLTHPIGSKVIFAALGSHHEEIHDDLEAHATLVSAHGAVSAATANAIVRRDASARFRAATPDHAADVATKSYVDGIVPIGAIIMWSGSVGSIPNGWALCNGSNGTPDLRGRFVVGGGGSYSTGSSGGQQSHSHSGPSHTHSSAAHTHGVFSGGSHNHGGSTGPPSNLGDKTGGPGDMPHPNHSHSVSNTGTSHDHSGSTGSTTPAATGASGTASTSTGDHLPPWWALAYIMRVS